MNREYAIRECERLAAESPDSSRSSWIPRRRDDGSWEVVRLDGVPSANRSRTAETRADERPPTGEDPRTAAVRNAGPWVGPG
jgi:hypothetical protein